MIETGKFDYYLYQDTLRSIHVKSVALDYVLDTKGFFQPVYKFTINVNENDIYDGVIYIPALKK